MPSESSKCGFFCLKSSCCQRFADIRIFVFLMCAVIAVQGTYLGYMVGVLTSLERRFEINSSRSGFLLSMYDVGHTVTVILVGYFGAHRHKPRFTAYGVLLSGLAMVGLALPNFLYGAKSRDEEVLTHVDSYINNTSCDPQREFDSQVVHKSCDMYEHGGAYAILLVFQLIAGIAAAPFNTLAYVYIDDNVKHNRSPLYLGLLTSMYAFGPAFGFLLSAGCNTLYVHPTEVPNSLDASNPNWVGAWWLGFLVCAVLYLLCAIPLFLFPEILPKPSQQNSNSHEMKPLNREVESFDQEDTNISCKDNCIYLGKIVTNLPSAILDLLKNPVYTSMMFGWIFGSYLVGGYGTYLPKYIQMQYHQTPALADIYAALISIGSVAVSTAVGGYLLTRYEIRPRKATLLLLITWTLIFITYLIGMATGCHQPQLAGSRLQHNRWNITESCNHDCQCDAVFQFEPICLGNKTYFSPCHAGCEYDASSSHEHQIQHWINCACAGDSELQAVGNFCPVPCSNLPLYLTIMFIGLFLGNLFFMTTMMVVLRCVPDDRKALALSFASCITNLFGFIPGPIVLGSVIDTSCIAWHFLCPNQQGNCIAYDNNQFRHRYHLTSAGFQLAAIISVSFTWIFSRKFTFPEDEEWEDEVQERVGRLEFISKTAGNNET